MIDENSHLTCQKQFIHMKFDSIYCHVYALTSARHLCIILSLVLVHHLEFVIIMRRRCCGGKRMREHARLVKKMKKKKKRITFMILKIIFVIYQYHKILIKFK